MDSEHLLTRFNEAQKNSFENALKEIENGRKVSHWMWFIFPQLAGLGSSPMAQKYALQDIAEATAYLNDPILGERLEKISRKLLTHQDKTAYEIFGSPDDMKLRSSMTIFSLVPGASGVFQEVLDVFYNGEPDPMTLKLA